MIQTAYWRLEKKTVIPISLSDAVLGAKVTVPTPSGLYRMDE